MSDATPVPRRSREATRQLWAERLARFAVAEQSIAAFCAAEGVSVNGFFYLVCYPKSEPCGMRVSEPREGRRETKA